MAPAYLFLAFLNTGAFLYCFKRRWLLLSDCAMAVLLPSLGWLGAEAAFLPAFPPPSFTLLLAEAGALVLLLRLVNDQERWLPILICAFSLIATTAALLNFVGLGIPDLARRGISIGCWAIATLLVAASFGSRFVRFYRGNTLPTIAQGESLG